MKTDRNSRLHKISQYVQTYLKESYAKRTEDDKATLHRYLLGVDYRWKHTLRVAQFGKVIAETEAANDELVLAASLLHDLAWFDTNADNSRQHGRLGSEIARQILARQGYNKSQIKNICY